MLLPFQLAVPAYRSSDATGFPWVFSAKTADCNAFTDMPSFQVFRDGVAEGQYDEILQTEIMQLKKVRLPDCYSVLVPWPTHTLAALAMCRREKNPPLQPVCVTLGLETYLRKTIVRGTSVHVAHACMTFFCNARGHGAFASRHIRCTFKQITLSQQCWVFGTKVSAEPEQMIAKTSPDPHSRAACTAIKVRMHACVCV